MDRSRIGSIEAEFGDVRQAGVIPSVAGEGANPFALAVLASLAKSRSHSLYLVTWASERACLFRDFEEFGYGLNASNSPNCPASSAQRRAVLDISHDRRVVMRRNYWLAFSAVAVLVAFLCFGQTGSTDEGESRERQTEVNRLQDARAELKELIYDLKTELEAVSDEGEADDAEELEQKLRRVLAEYREVEQRLAKLGAKKEQPNQKQFERKRLEEVRAVLAKEEHELLQKQRVLLEELESLKSNSKVSDDARKESAAIVQALLKTKQMVQAIRAKAASIEHAHKKADGHGDAGHRHEEKHHEHPDHEHADHHDHEHADHRDNKLAHEERRIEHMLQASRHLDEAGMHDEARRLREGAEQHRRELQRHIHGQEHGDISREVLENLHALRKEVGMLRKEVHEMRELIGDFAK